MQACVDWVLIIFGAQVIEKKQPVWPVFSDYLSVFYDYDLTLSIGSSLLPYNSIFKLLSNLFCSDSKLPFQFFFIERNFICFLNKVSLLTS